MAARNWSAICRYAGRSDVGSIATSRVNHAPILVYTSDCTSREILVLPPLCHSVSVAGAIVNNDGRVLAIRRRDNGHWEPPGGVLELDETIEHGLIREVREETGLTVKPERLTGVYKNMERGIVALVFRCSIASGTVSPTAEVQESAWLTPDEIKGHMDEAYAIRLLDALEQSRAPAIRTHNGVTLTGPGAGCTVLK
jgi:ADP-ribose pyrophosphatase YjhB (NUDIX family)